MEKISQKNSNPSQNKILTPAPRLPLLITGLGIAILPLRLTPWISILIIVFGLFLTVQCFTLRLEFTPDDLVVWQLGKELRRFPFKKWL